MGIREAIRDLATSALGMQAGVRGPLLQTLVEQVSAPRARLMLEFAMASNAPKRSDSISSSRVGEAHVAEKIEGRGMLRTVELDE